MVRHVHGSGILSPFLILTTRIVAGNHGSVHNINQNILDTTRINYRIDRMTINIYAARSDSDNLTGA